MDIRQITPRFFAAPQIDPSDMEAIKEAGVTLILCNRPDAEVPPSHQHAAIQAAAEAAGLRFAVQELTHQTMTPDVIARNLVLRHGHTVDHRLGLGSGRRTTGRRAD